MAGHRRQAHRNCPCTNCTDAEYHQEATVCGVLCRPLHLQNLAPLTANLVQKLNNLTFLSEEDELVPLNVPTVEEIHASQRTKVAEYFNAVLETYTDINNLSANQLADKNTHAGNVVKLIMCLPGMVLRHKQPKEDRSALFRRFLDSDYKKLFEEAQQYSNRTRAAGEHGQTNPNNQKAKRAKKLVRRGRLRSAFQTLQPGGIKPVSEELTNVLQSKFPAQKAPVPGQQSTAEFQDFTTEANVNVVSTW